MRTLVDTSALLSVVLKHRSELQKPQPAIQPSIMGDRRETIGNYLPIDTSDKSVRRVVHSMNHTFGVPIGAAQQRVLQICALPGSWEFGKFHQGRQHSVACQDSGSLCSGWKGAAAACVSSWV